MSQNVIPSPEWLKQRMKSLRSKPAPSAKSIISQLGEAAHNHYWNIPTATTFKEIAIKSGKKQPTIIK